MREFWSNVFWASLVFGVCMSIMRGVDAWDAKRRRRREGGL